MAFLRKVVAFLASPQGKRDMLRIVSAVAAIATFLKQTGVI